MGLEKRAVVINNRAVDTVWKGRATLIAVGWDCYGSGPVERTLLLCSVIVVCESNGPDINFASQEIIYRQLSAKLCCVVLYIMSRTCS